MQRLKELATPPNPSVDEQEELEPFLSWHRTKRHSQLEEYANELVA